MANHLDNIVSLSNALSELEGARAAIDGIPEWMSELHEEYSGRLAEIEKLEAEVEEARRERRAAEAVIEDAQERMKRFQQQINQVSTQREYGALLQEIDTTKAQISEAEEQGLAAMERREEAETQLVTSREAFSELEQRYQQELAKWEQEKPQIADHIKQLERDIEALHEQLPRGLLAQFERIRERRDGQGLAEIRVAERGGRRTYHCGACNYRVRPQAVVEIRSKGSLVQCDSCKRILHLAAEETA